MIHKPAPLTPPVAPKPYRTPAGKFIPRAKKTANLYRLEQVRNEAIMAAAVELQQVLTLEDRFREAIPEALFRVLQSFDKKAAYIAAAAYIAKHADIGSELEAKGRRFAFSTVSVGDKFGIVRFYENDPEPDFQSTAIYISEETAIQLCRKMNHAAGILDHQAAMIVMSSLQAKGSPTAAPTGEPR